MVDVRRHIRDVDAPGAGGHLEQPNVLALLSVAKKENGGKRASLTDSLCHYMGMLLFKTEFTGFSVLLKINLGEMINFDSFNFFNSKFCKFLVF